MQLTMDYYDAAHGGTPSRAIGLQADIDVHARILRAEPAAAFLLCSDSLASALSDGHIACCLRTAPADGAKEALESLMGAAVPRAPRNVAAVVVCVHRNLPGPRLRARQGRADGRRVRASRL